MKKLRTPLIYLFVILLAFVCFWFLSSNKNGPKEIQYTDFLQSVKDDGIGKILLSEITIQIWDKLPPGTQTGYADTPDRYASIPSYTAFIDDMAAIVAQQKGIDKDLVTSRDYSFEFEYKAPEGESVLLMLLPYLLMAGLLGTMVFFFMRQQQGGGNAAMNFAKSRARMQVGSDNKITFDSVAGADEEKEELKEVVEFMRAPKRFADMGARIPKGVLLVGPPGTGKTLLAKAAAGEANVPFFSISGSDFVEMFVGVGASRVRDLFATAKKCAPAVVFIDEIDAVGRQRGAGLGGGHDEREQTLNQILVEMDGFSENQGIIVIAATNRPDILDPALIRPGRFDRRITVNYPDVKGREAILNVHAKGKPLAPGVNLGTLAKMTPGFTGADLENVLNEGAILAARIHISEITMHELEEAITRVMMGPEKRSRIISDEDKRITAYHEAGHAIVSLKLDKCDPLHEVSIIPRGQAGGYTLTLPKDDEQHMMKHRILDNIAMLLGGRAAELVALSDISTGAYNDLQVATGHAKRMVTEFGMSDELGLVFHGGAQEVFVGKEFGHQRDYSEQVAAKIDDEIKRILGEQFERARAVIASNREALDRVVLILIEREILTGDQFERIYNGEDPITVFTDINRDEITDAMPENAAKPAKDKVATEPSKPAKDKVATEPVKPAKDKVATEPVKPSEKKLKK
ncbi:MAG: ATP-dependent zinc metalloprotease FtsH [Clostridia bacterium]